jgi:hypothetical protein
MIHLYTVKHPTKQWVVSWLAPEKQDTQQTPVFERAFSRVVIGAACEEGPHAVVLAERRILFPQASAYYYLVLDEAFDPLAQNLFEQIIALKDRYLVPLVATAPRPTTIISALRSLEGLTHYQMTNEHSALAVWPTFHSFETLASVRVQEPPDEAGLHQALEEHLKADLINPVNGEPILAGDNTPVKRLQLPGDFPTQQTAAGVRQSAIGSCQALYYAIEALWPTRNLQGRKNDVRPEPRKGNPVTGY